MSERSGNRIHWVDIPAILLFLALAGVVLLQFLSLYVLNDSVAWTEEIARYLLIGVAYAGSLTALRKGLGTTWSDTVVAVVTEFGRTVPVNGTRGTDHGTASAAILLGGAVDGGRVIADWPGLSKSDLYQERDLMPTTDMRGLFKGILIEHLGLSSTLVERSVFPDSQTAKPVLDLVQV